MTLQNNGSFKKYYEVTKVNIYKQTFNPLKQFEFKLEIHETIHITPVRFCSRFLGTIKNGTLHGNRQN